MKFKTIKIKGDSHESFIKIVASQYGIIAPMELKLIKILIDMDAFNPFFLDKYTRAKLEKAMECPPSTLSSCLSRLDKANVLVRKGKTRWFNASFRDLSSVDCIIFKA